MNTILISVCSRSDKPSLSLQELFYWAETYPDNLQYNLKFKVAYDAASWYEGHSKNIESAYLNDGDIVVMCHDDIEILQGHDTFTKLVSNVNKKDVGFVGVAGSTMVNRHGTWWQDRNVGATRGFVFQGKSMDKMVPNYFGEYGQVAVLDGCFLAVSYNYLKANKLVKPSYLTSNWDFYDISLTFEAYLRGLNNYALPILIKHESPGMMREQWVEAKNSFLKYYNHLIPVKIPLDKTLGMPK